MKFEEKSLARFNSRWGKHKDITKNRTGEITTMEEKNFSIHIENDTNLTLKELIETLSILNLSINDYYRDNGVSNYSIADFSPSIKKVKEGSVFLEIAIPVFTSITSTLLAEYIKSRFEKKKGKNNNNEPSIVNVYIAESNQGQINIDLSGRR